LTHSTPILKRIRHTLRGPLVNLFLHGVARLPLPVAHAIGASLGALFYAFPTKLRQVTAVNLQLCFPQVPPSQTNALCRTSLREVGKNMAEVGLLWLGSRERVLGCVHSVKGEDVLRKAVADSKGVLLISPHIGAWELMGLYLSMHYPMTSMYRPPRVHELDTLMRSARERFGARLVPTDASGVRAQLQALKKGELVGVLPDQDPGTEGGAFAPFFGVPANTVTFVPRLLNKTKCTGLFAFAIRLPHGRGFDLHFEPIPAEAAGDDMAIALAAINNKVEEIARRFPEQYLWSYERFRTRPDGGQDPYG